MTDGDELAIHATFFESINVAMEEEGSTMHNCWMSLLSWVVTASRELELGVACPNGVEASRGWVIPSMIWCT